MHNAAFKHFDISATYELFDIPESEFDKFFDEYVFNGKLNGFNVTVPYKIKAFEKIRSSKRVFCFPEGVEKFLCSINTVKVEPDNLYGDNTDLHGFLISLTEETSFILNEKKIFISGAGGAGGPISIFMAGDKDIGMVNVYDPDPDKLEFLRVLFEGTSISGKINLIESKEDVPAKLRECDLFVNASGLGTKIGDLMPINPNMLKNGAVVYDLVYARETELVTRARARGLTAVNGLGMLVNQGALAFEIWTGKPYEEIRKVMHRAAEEKLKGAA